MKKPIILIIAALALVGLIIGATLIYNGYMSANDNDKPSNIVVVGKGDKPENNTKDESSADNAEAVDTTVSADSESYTEDEEAVEETVANDGEGEHASTSVGAEEETVSPYLAPDITVYDKNGKAYKLSDFRGKPIVLNFWSSGCGPCQAEMPHFQDAYEKYGDKVEFLIVNCIGFFGDTVESASAYINSEGYTFPVYYDVNNEAVGTYIGNSIPYTFFINRDFDLYTYIPGMAAADDIETCIGWILE